MGPSKGKNEAPGFLWVLHFMGFIVYLGFIVVVNHPELSFEIGIHIS